MLMASANVFLLRAILKDAPIGKLDEATANVQKTSLNFSVQSQSSQNSKTALLWLPIA